MPTPVSNFRLPVKTLATLDALVAHAHAKDPSKPYAHTRTAMLILLIEHQASILHVSPLESPPAPLDPHPPGSVSSASGG